jgi:hypothetical protein
VSAVGEAGEDHLCLVQRKRGLEGDLDRCETATRVRIAKSTCFSPPAPSFVWEALSRWSCQTLSTRKTVEGIRGATTTGKDEPDHNMKKDSQEAGVARPNPSVEKK